MMLDRATRLRELNRHDEAVAMFLQHLAGEPEDAWAHYELAMTRYEMDGEGKAALESIRTAIQLEPEESHFFASQALILKKIDQHKRALESAERAIALDSDRSFNWATKGAALSGMQRWAEAEEACREALALDPDDEFALNQLAIFLRLQGKVSSSMDEVSARLERDAEDPLAHANAGWTVFQGGDLPKAEEHFKEALRLDPSMEYARMGLLEAYRARSLFYRIYLKWVFFLQKYSEKQQLVIGREVLAKIDVRLAIALAVLYCFFAFGSYLASGIGSFLVLKDRAARLTLKRREKQEGIFVGGGFFLGLILIALAFVCLPIPFAMLGATLIIAGVPGGMFWDNDSRPGRFVFGGLMAIVYLGGGVHFLSRLSAGSGTEWGAMAGMGFLVAIFAGGDEGPRNRGVCERKER